MPLFNSASLSQGLTNVPAEKFGETSVVAHLYRSSQQASTHAEGSDCIRALLGYVADLRRSGTERATEAQVVSRVQDSLEFAKAVFAQIPQVEAVVLYGSALRGKPAPKDFDIRLVTSFMEPDHSDWEHPKMNALQAEVDRAFRENPGIPKTIAGLSTEVMVNSAFHDSGGMELDYVERGPYLVVMRGNMEGTFAAFINLSGTEYLSERAA